MEVNSDHTADHLLQYPSYFKNIHNIQIRDQYMYIGNAIKYLLIDYF